MKNLKKSHWVLIAFSVLILAGCMGMTAYLLFSNYHNVQLFKQAQENFLRGDDASLSLAETQLLEVVKLDNDNEAAYAMLGSLAGKRNIHPEQVYYCYMAHRLNPLDASRQDDYIKSLFLARYFDRLEHFLAHQTVLPENYQALLLYAAGRNDNFNKYKKQFAHLRNDHSFGELSFLLFDTTLPAAEKLAALENLQVNELLEQELFEVRSKLYLSMGDTDNAEKVLLEAYKLNAYAFAPALGRFYANYRTLSQALEVYEKHLTIYHDPMIALQTAELYCLLKRTDDIARLRMQYQADSGNSAMLLCYYFDALIAISSNDLSNLKNYIAPLRENIHTPLALYIFFTSDIQEKNLSAIRKSYTAMLSNKSYVKLMDSADEMLLHFLQNNFAGLRDRDEELLALAELLYSRKKDAFTAKLILLIQKNRNTVNLKLLKDALRSFPQDQGIIKLAIEYHLQRDYAECSAFITYYKRTFPKNADDMINYEIVLALLKNDYDQASVLFRKNFLPELRDEYWEFARATMREADLLFLSQDKLYEPFCKALLLIKAGKNSEACDILLRADAHGNMSLLFFAASTLKANAQNEAALNLYAQIPENSPYQLRVLMQTADIHAAQGNLTHALELAGQAYDMAPDSDAAQLCYADKLYRNGQLSTIPDVIKLKSATTLRKRMESLWIEGMQQKIKDCEQQKSWEKLRELCRQLLVVDPDNNIALECLKRLNKMPQ